MRITFTKVTLLTWLRKQKKLLGLLDDKSIPTEPSKATKAEIYRALCINNAKIRYLLEERLERSGAYNAYELGLLVESTGWPGLISDVGILGDKVAEAILTGQDKYHMEKEYLQFVGLFPQDRS